MNTDDAHGGLNAAVAATLNGERVASGMTYDQLAARVGISKRQLMRLLSNAERDIDVNVLAALAGAFRMSPTDVMARAEERLRRNPKPADSDISGMIAWARHEAEMDADTGQGEGDTPLRA